MPKYFMAEQFAAWEALGELRTQKSFVGDTQAWRTYQETYYSTLHPGEALSPVKLSSRRRLDLCNRIACKGRISGWLTGVARGRGGVSAGARTAARCRWGTDAGCWPRHGGAFLWL